MSVIVVVQGNPNPAESGQLLEYQRAAGPIIAKHRGQVLARGAGVRSIAGSGRWQTGIVLRFPDEASVEAWHSDPAYQQIVPLRSSGYSELEIHVFRE